MIKLILRGSRDGFGPATIIEAKGCRVLRYYDDVPAFYDEWIDISRERLREKRMIKKLHTILNLTI